MIPKLMRNKQMSSHCIVSVLFIVLFIYLFFICKLSSIYILVFFFKRLAWLILISAHFWNIYHVFKIYFANIFCPVANLCFRSPRWPILDRPSRSWRSNGLPIWLLLNLDKLSLKIFFLLFCCKDRQYYEPISCTSQWLRVEIRK